MASSASSPHPPSDATAASRDTTHLAPVLTPGGWELLNSLGGYRESEALALSTRLRAAGHEPELVSAVLTQLKLREQAADKFGPFAAQMVFTRSGIEQATRLNVAALHAGRFAGAGLASVADLGCGLGADALALAALELEVTAVERDETVAAAATINLMPFPNATVVCADAQEWLAGVGVEGPGGPGGPGEAGPRGYWFDPARRVLSTSGSSRVFDPEAFSPPLSFVEALADRGAAVGVKLGPGLPHEAVPQGCEAQWVSVDGQVVEAVLWFNVLARQGVRRSALVLSGAGQGHHELTASTDFGDSPSVPVGGTEALTGYLYEPDGAVIRAGLVADLVQRDFAAAGGALLDEHIAYFRADTRVESPLARAYRIEQVMPYNVKGLKRWVRETGVGRLDIKKRGMAVTPEELRRQLMAGQSGKGKGQGRKSAGRHATLVLTRIGEDRVAVEVTPV